MTLHTGWWTSLAPSSFQITIQLRGDAYKSVSKFFVERATSATSSKSILISACFGVSYTQMWEELLDVLKISIGDIVWRCAPCMDGVLADWSMVSKEDITFAYLLHGNIQMTVQFCTYSLIFLQVENVRMAWPVSMKLDFWGHICALLHSEALSLEGWGQVFKCISWFESNSVIRGRGTPHLGDFLHCLGTNPSPTGAEGHKLTFKLAAVGKYCEPVGCIPGNYSKLDFFTSEKYFKAYRPKPRAQI